MQSQDTAPSGQVRVDLRAEVVRRLQQRRKRIPNTFKVSLRRAAAQSMARSEAGATSIMRAMAAAAPKAEALTASLEQRNFDLQYGSSVPVRGRDRVATIRARIEVSRARRTGVLKETMATFMAQKEDLMDEALENLKAASKKAYEEARTAAREEAVEAAQRAREAEELYREARRLTEMTEAEKKAFMTRAKNFFPTLVFNTIPDFLGTMNDFAWGKGTKRQRAFAKNYGGLFRSVAKFGAPHVAWYLPKKALGMYGVTAAELAKIVFGVTVPSFALTAAGALAGAFVVAVIEGFETDKDGNLVFKGEPFRKALMTGTFQATVGLFLPMLGQWFTWTNTVQILGKMATGSIVGRMGKPRPDPPRPYVPKPDPYQEAAKERFRLITEEGMSFQEAMRYETDWKFRTKRQLSAMKAKGLLGNMKALDESLGATKQMTSLANAAKGFGVLKSLSAVAGALTAAYIVITNGGIEVLASWGITVTTKLRVLLDAWLGDGETVKYIKNQIGPMILQFTGLGKHAVKGARFISKRYGVLGVTAGALAGAIATGFAGEVVGLESVGGIAAVGTVAVGAAVVVGEGTRKKVEGLKKKHATFKAMEAFVTQNLLGGFLETAATHFASKGVMTAIEAGALVATEDMGSLLETIGKHSTKGLPTGAHALAAAYKQEGLRGLALQVGAEAHAGVVEATSLLQGAQALSDVSIFRNGLEVIGADGNPKTVVAGGLYDTKDKIQELGPKKIQEAVDNIAGATDADLLALNMMAKASKVFGAPEDDLAKIQGLYAGAVAKGKEIEAIKARLKEITERTKEGNFTGADMTAALDGMKSLFDLRQGIGEAGNDIAKAYMAAYTAHQDKTFDYANRAAHKAGARAGAKVGQEAGERAKRKAANAYRNAYKDAIKDGKSEVDAEAVGKDAAYGALEDAMGAAKVLGGEAAKAAAINAGRRLNEVTNAGNDNDRAEVNERLDKEGEAYKNSGEQQAEDHFGDLDTLLEGAVAQGKGDLESEKDGNMIPDNFGETEDDTTTTTSTPTTTGYGGGMMSLPEGTAAAESIAHLLRSKEANAEQVKELMGALTKELSEEEQKELALTEDEMGALEADLTDLQGPGARGFMKKLKKAIEKTMDGDSARCLLTQNPNDPRCLSDSIDEIMWDAGVGAAFGAGNVAAFALTGGAANIAASIAARTAGGGLVNGGVGITDYLHTEKKVNWSFGLARLLLEKPDIVNTAGKDILNTVMGAGVSAMEVAEAAADWESLDGSVYGFASYLGKIAGKGVMGTGKTGWAAFRVMWNLNSEVGDTKAYEYLRSGEGGAPSSWGTL